MCTKRAALLLLLLLASGCVATAVYGSARPLPPGEVQAVVLVEQVAHGDAILAPDRADETFAAAAPGPGLEMRFGLEPGLDLGLRLSTGSAFAADLKIGLLQSDRAALALDPAIQLGPYAYADGRFSGQGSLRVLASWRASDAVELVGHATAGVLNDRGGFRAETVGTWGGGLGPLFRVSPAFALQPSLSMLWRSDRASWHPELAMGLGFLLGREAP